MSYFDISPSDLKTISEMLVLIKRNLNWAAEVYPGLAPSWLTWTPLDDWKFISSCFDDSIYTIENFYKIDDTKRKEITFALNNHGLVGSPLQRKSTRLISGIDKVRAVFSNVRSKVGGRKVIGFMLELVDDYMDSFSAAFPPLGTVTEFKKAIKTGLQAPELLNKKP